MVLLTESDILKDSNFLKSSNILASYVLSKNGIIIKHILIAGVSLVLMIGAINELLSGHRNLSETVALYAFILVLVSLVIFLIIQEVREGQFILAILVDGLCLRKRSSDSYCFIPWAVITKVTIARVGSGDDRSRQLIFTIPSKFVIGFPKFSNVVLRKREQLLQVETHVWQLYVGCLSLNEMNEIKNISDIYRKNSPKIR